MVLPGSGGRSRRRGVAGKLLVAAGLASLSGCGEAPPPPPKHVTEVEVTPVALTQFAPEVALTGQIAARIQSQLAFRIEGRIAARNVEVGDHVTKGQILARLETTQQEADVSAAKAGVASAEATLKEAESSFSRQKDLIGQGFTTRPNFDSAKQALDGAKAGLDGARAALGSAEDALANTELRADADGVVTARTAEVGQVVAVAQAVYTVAQDGARDAVFDVFEALPAKPPPDKRVEITLLSNPAIKTIGVVREVSPTVDAARGTVRVKIALDRPPPEMSLGAPVQGAGRFKPADTIVLPWTAFFAENGKPAVWIVDPNAKTASLRKVDVLGYRTGQLVLNDGLKAGELVVTRGGQLLRPGQTVDFETGGAAPKPEGQP
ncbi:efflux RND transporter periplasmic adaptor subunit [Chenggangzhangella methanolivorans]|uniref:Efflux RND transporter periplasmic adaptor subunit n=1 Tax=Chenggangzhangella methanolivorans TaxID=1437009 RepID=A0A9E6UML4_9HYPH|nr:efflux RND transporter periplasmic adaptor subunit [Chenggangzhangella methanolivorans]QZO01832.1 efflux RND transporter periplasmic adaptor subunit [Chenggangzhangella methanolivorans]